MPNYNRLYAIYKSLPLIVSFIIALAAFVWSIYDVIDNSNWYSHYYNSGYGILELDSPVLCVLIWWAIGAAAFFINLFFMSLAISPTVVRTDAVLELNEKIKKD